MADSRFSPHGEIADQHFSFRSSQFLSHVDGTLVGQDDALVLGVVLQMVGAAVQHRTHLDHGTIAVEVGVKNLGTVGLAKDRLVDRGSHFSTVYVERGDNFDITGRPGADLRVHHALGDRAALSVKMNSL